MTKLLGNNIRTWHFWVDKGAAVGCLISKAPHNINSPIYPYLPDTDNQLSLFEIFGLGSLNGSQEASRHDLLVWCCIQFTKPHVLLMVCVPFLYELCHRVASGWTSHTRGFLFVPPLPLPIRGAGWSRGTGRTNVRAAICRVGYMHQLRALLRRHSHTRNSSATSINRSRSRYPPAPLHPSLPILFAASK